MRRSVLVVFAMVALSAFLACATSVSPGATRLVPPLTAQDDRPGVGVLPFVDGGSFGDDPQDYERLQVGVQQLLMTELAFASNLRIVERSQLRALMEEQDLPADRVDARTAAAMGAIVGAKYMILGGFVDIQGNFRLDARIVDTETTEILHARRVTGSYEDLFSLLVDLAEQLTDVAQFPELPPLPEGESQPARSEEVPALVVKRYARAIELQDAGRSDEAEDLLEDIVAEFPGFVAAAQALEQTG